jgi:hypothetical protein
MTNEEILIKSIFDAEEAPDGYPDTMRDKSGYAEYVITQTLPNISRVIARLSRLHRLLIVSEKDGINTLPDIIAHNELRRALEPLLQVNNDVQEVTEMLRELYHATKAPKGE